MGNFFVRESVTIALLFTGIMTLVAAAMPSMFHNALVVAGLAGTWVAVLMTGVNRL